MMMMMMQTSCRQDAAKLQLHLRVSFSGLEGSSRPRGSPSKEWRALSPAIAQ